ncbi:AfsR/SARP family transcriptional regulator [Streptomyces hyaluromycini]|uniref:AfsR/SARP family transcriptional regulator n=1 Tax=Streptomyces hyaluromycini TaxID=1377993 RepID=UPI001FE92C9D|nr:BTAD domain-containing putative transcriptional regulator [Streptomyces hyaluromycini]
MRAWRGSNEVELGPPQQRAVLGALLLAEGSQVSIGELADAVWGTSPPASAPGILRMYIHGLRKALEPSSNAASSVIRLAGGGYQLSTSRDNLDLGAFRALLDQAGNARRAGDVENAVEYLRDAIGLWQGTPLAGVRVESMQSQRQQLGELRLFAEATRLTLELDLGAHEKAVAELTGLVAEHPLDERFRELLMLALYRSGRQAAALETYREVQSLLAEELGVDPGQALQVMYQRILRADAGLVASSTPAEPERLLEVSIPTQLPADLPVFVGRDAELAEVARLPLAGTVVVSAIAGMAGVGKTTFAVRWARHVADHFPDGQLYLNLRGFDPAGQPVSPEHALRTILDSLGVDASTVPQGTDALAARYRTLLTGKRVLLLLDNARDAAQVRPLLPGAPGSLAIVTSRNRLSGLVATDGAHPVYLDVLSTPEARALLICRLGQQRVEAEPAAVEEIITRCARLPLALAVIAARAMGRPAFPLAAIAAELHHNADRLDAFHDGDDAANVRAVFSWSYHALTPDAARLFRLLALHPGPDITQPAISSLAGHSASHTRKLLSELTQAHLIDEVTPGRFASHDLLRAYATELAETAESSQQTQAARNRMLDHYLHTAHQASTLINLARAPITLMPAAEGVRPEDFAGNAADAVAWFAAEQAILIAAIDDAAKHRFDVHAWQLAWAIANHLYQRGLWDDLEAVRLAGMDAARRLGDHEAQADAHQGLAVAASGQGRYDVARTHAERAIAMLTESGEISTRPGFYITLAWVAEQQDDLDAALNAAQRSLEISQAHDIGNNNSRRTLAAALGSVGWYHSRLGQNQQALDFCRQALPLHLEVGDVTNAAGTWDSIGHAHHHLGEFDEAVVSFRNSLSLHRKHGGTTWFIVDTLESLGDTYLCAGHPDEARAAWTEGMGIAEHHGHSGAESIRKKLHQLNNARQLFDAEARIAKSD